MRSGKNKFSRGELARETGVHGETIRYYESIGLLPEPSRSVGGHRIYDTFQLRRISFISRSRELGFTLNEVRSLLALFDSGDYSCAEVRDRTRTHIDDVNRRIGALQAMRDEFEAMVRNATAVRRRSARSWRPFIGNRSALARLSITAFSRGVRSSLRPRVGNSQRPDRRYLMRAAMARTKTTMSRIQKRPMPNIIGIPISIQSIIGLLRRW